MTAFRVAGLEVVLRSDFPGLMGGLPVTYEAAAIPEALAPGLEIELVRSPERNGRPRAPDHPRFAARRDGEALIVERPDCVGRVEVGEPVRARFALSDDPYTLEACVRVAIAVALARRDAFILHASAVKWRDEALVFTGVSGAGKSTIAQLLMAKCERLADELLVLSRTPEGWQVVIPPFLGITDLPRGSTTPLAAVHLIQQAAAPRVVPLPRAQALRELLRHVVVYAAEPATAGLVLDLADRLTQEIPCVRLEFANDPTVAGVLGII